MKTVFLFFIGLTVVACSKNKQIVNKMEGAWMLYDILHYDGSHSYPNKTYIFEKGEADGKSFLPLTVVTNSNTSKASYLVTNKGNDVYFDYSPTTNTIDTCSVEDFGKSLLILRQQGDVLYFKRLK